MAGVTTIALLERRAGMPRELFSRYWRDVHGVMAARIPGFEKYVQHHVTAIGAESGTEDKGLNFEGIAVVEFARDGDRVGLGSSPVTPEIVRDEPNLFARALLYNLAPGDSLRLNEDSARDSDDTIFLLFEDGQAARQWAHACANNGSEVHLHDVSGADPALWNGIEAGAIGWSHIVQCWPGGRKLPPVGRNVVSFRTDARYVMVDKGRPTPLGLRGADALRTIREAGAENQLDEHVEKLVYGI